MLDEILAFAAGVALGATLMFAGRRDMRVFYFEARGNRRRGNGSPGADQPASPAPGDDP
jgi:hypothetical protein